MNKAIKRAVYFKFSLRMTASEVGLVVGLGAEGWATVGRVEGTLLVEIEGDDTITEDGRDEPDAVETAELDALPMLETEEVADGSKETDVSFWALTKVQTNKRAANKNTVETFILNCCIEKR